MANGYVRAANPDDAGEIARIQLATWRQAYRRLVPAHILDKIDQAWIKGRWLASIETPPSPRHRVLVAADESALAPQEDPLAVLSPRIAAITDLLVEPRWGRRGHGSRLLAACTDLWRSDGFDSAVAWAFEADTAMRAFLTSAGWQPDGATRALDVDDLLVPQIRLHTALTELPPA
jgi:GNAT superfamily N-acetyltransferase